MSERAEPGWWYYVECSNCGEEALFARASSPDEEAVPKVRGVKLTCQNCGVEAVYPPSAVRRGEVKD
jgi:hypothetical protein